MRPLSCLSTVLPRLVAHSGVIPLLLLTGFLLSGCSSERENLTPATQALAVGLGVEIVKARLERRLEVTCNPLNLISDGTYCVSNYKPTDRQEVWCFKTLAGVDCYGEPDPYSLQGRALPDTPRALADPRMPMTPPGRRNQSEQIAVAPVGAEAIRVVPAGNPPIMAPVGMPVERNPVIIAPVARPLPLQAPDATTPANTPADDIQDKLAQ